MGATTSTDGPIPVTVHNFVRAETDVYFAKSVADGAFGKLVHNRAPVAIDAQVVVRSNRDTLYSMGVFDLAAGPVTIELPDAGQRFMSMQVLSQDHYTLEVVYGPARRVYDQALVGTRYLFLIIRTLADPNDPADVQAANAAQDAIALSQASTGAFEIPTWDPVSQGRVRDALAVLGAAGGLGKAFGTPEQVDPIDRLIGASIGWGGNPPEAAFYASVEPPRNDGDIVHVLTVGDVPVDGFWSISIYNAKGFFQASGQGGCSLNNLTAKSEADGSVRIQFGGCGPDVANCLAITPGWNYTIRLYRPRQAILDGSWTFPVAQPVG
jgi:para-nitrobenzyl esterase